MLASGYGIDHMKSRLRYSTERPNASLFFKRADHFFGSYHGRNKSCIEFILCFFFLTRSQAFGGESGSSL